MAEGGETTFVFKADTKSAENSLDSFGDKVLSVGKTVGAAVAVYFSFGALKNGIAAATEAAMESEKAILAFNSALSLSGQFSQAASDSFLKFASTLEKTTGIQDEVILKNSALLVSLGHLSGQGLEQATKAALDLSRGMQIDVNQAFDIVTKATQGNVMALSKYGLEVNKADSDGQKFAKTLQFIKENFGGLSEGTINTFEGALGKMKNGFDDIVGSIGKWITKSPKLIAILQLMGDYFYQLSDSVTNSKSTMDGFIDSLFSFGKWVTQNVLKPLEIVSNYIASTFMVAIDGLMRGFHAAAKASDTLLGTSFAEKMNTTVAVWSAATVSMQEQAAAFDTSTSQAIVNGLDKVQAKVDETASKIKVSLPTAVADSAKAVTTTMTNLGSAIAGGFANIISGATQKLVTNLMKGQNAFSGFASVVANLMGDLAIQLGTLFITTGIAIEATKSLSGFAAIAAGIGLIAVGTILKSLAGSGGETPAAPGSASGLQATGGGFGTDQVSEEERTKPQTGVQVIVQGNLLNTRESALEIAKVLNDAFDTNGTMVRAFS